MEKKLKMTRKPFITKFWFGFLMSGLGCSGGVGHMESDPK
jgi:hypothetical protein